MTTKYTPEIVGIHYDILHYPFWTYEFKTLNLKQTKVTRKYMRGGYILEITNPRATFRDAAILLGVIKLYEFKIMTGDCRKNDIKDIDENVIGYSYVITTTDRELCKFCGVSKGSSTVTIPTMSIKRRARSRPKGASGVVRWLASERLPIQGCSI
ncbi:MAG: hypothetical protein PHY09_08165 [Desulfuromonadaceae bacterium]|nr:hypothetical protein [Desulfuromonadaceae bacterium]MDD5106297.1 hypothetical protein [Desulfuromonadaceae bacterium]